MTHPRRGPHRRPLLRAIATALQVGLPLAQQIDRAQPENDVTNRVVHYAVDGVRHRAGVMLDAGWRWLNRNGQTCQATEGKASLESCSLKGLDDAAYRKGYGIHVGAPSGSSLTLRFAAIDSYAWQPNYGSRVYLTDMDTRGGAGYVLFKPMGGEISFTVDLSRVPAGMNAAVYLVSMDKLGNLNASYGNGERNGAGWKRGLGYCDAQCPRNLKFVQGAGWNDGQLMSCCPEMDLFEANRLAAAFTAHPCASDRRSVHTCTPTEGDCGASSYCDTAGADMNTFRRFGPSQALYEVIDPHEPFKVRTRFATDGTGSLELIEQIFEQGSTSFSANITDESMAAQKALFGEENDFARIGGLAQMGKALERGMVMALALWSDPGGNMNWLDSCLSDAYDCAGSSPASPKVFEDAPPGTWRGPVDAFPDMASSFASETVELSYPGIPEDWRSQAPFECSQAGGRWDCSSVEYQLVVSDISVLSRPPEPTEPPVRPAPAPAPAAPTPAIPSPASGWRPWWLLWTCGLGLFFASQG